MLSQGETPVRFPNRILCGLDLEGRAKEAFRAAVWLSERMGAPLELVHAFPRRPLLWGKEADMPEWVAGTEAVGRQLREALREWLAQSPPELGLRTSLEGLELHVRSGHPAHMILERARETRADLIVIGPHKKRGWLDLGSTARGVLAHASYGVWVQPAAATPVRRILVPLDLSPDSLRALAVARDLALRFGARVTAIQVFVPPVFGGAVPDTEAVDLGSVAEHLQRAERLQFETAMGSFDWRGVQHETRFEQGDPSHVVHGLEDEHDLVVMGTHGRTGLSAALLGGVAYAVLRSARIPVLALRHPRGVYLI